MAVPNNIKLTAAVLVLLLHATLLVRLQAHEPPPKKPPVDFLIRDITFIEKAISGNGFSDCPEFYLGFGFRDAYGSGRITDVAKGYAADRAGLRIGDHVRNTPGGPVGVEGLKMTFEVHRDGQVLMLTMVSEKICHR